MRRLRELERTLGMRIHDAESARQAAARLIAELTASGVKASLPPDVAAFTVENASLMHDQVRRLIGLPPIQRPP